MYVLTFGRNVDFSKKKQAWVSVMIGAQPFYIAHLKKKTTSENSAFGAMLIFVAVFLISSTYIVIENCMKKGTTDETRKGLVNYDLPPGVSEYGYTPLSTDGSAPTPSPGSGGLSQPNAASGEDTTPLVLS